ncbi:hypothetical protein V8B97DRAFT_1939047 [Scleroderma yunnanense]
MGVGLCIQNDCRLAALTWPIYYELPALPLTLQSLVDMTATARPTWFRAFRIIVFTSASVLCLVWSVLIIIYTVKNWSSYENGQRGFFAALAGLDFVSSILIYLMMVVQFTYWPDAARTVALTGLHAAGAIVLMALKPHLPCNAFGGWTVCNRLTNAIIVGTWAITGLLAAYALCSPFVARSQGKPSSTVSDPEKTLDRTMEAEGTEQDRLVEEEKPPQTPSADTRAWLLKNQEGMSPEAIPMGLPRLSDNGRTHSPASSMTLLPQPGTRSSQDITRSDPRLAGPSESTYWTSSPQSGVPRPLSAMDTTAPVPLRSSNPALHHPFSGLALPAIDQSGGNSIEEALILLQQRNSTTAVPDGYESSSVYSQPSSATHRTPTTARPTRRQLTREEDLAHPLITPVQDDGYTDQAEIDGHNGGCLDPPLTAFPVPDYSSGTAASQTAFELHLSGQSRPPSIDAGELLNMAAGVPRPHTRKDSAISIVDMDEWRKLVLGAAGKT